MTAVAVKPARGAPPAEPNAGSRFLDVTKVFAATSYWGDNPLPSDAALLSDTRTTAWVANLAYQLGLSGTTTPDGKFLTLRAGATGGMAWFNLDSGTPVYVVPANQPRIPIAQWNVAVGPPGPWLEASELHEQWIAGVPMPPAAYTSISLDKSIALYQPSTGYYADFWAYEWGSGTDPLGRPYQATAYWGGVMQKCWTRSGTFSNRTVNGVRIENDRMGTAATGLPLIGGIITPEEWNDPSTDSIRHPLNFVIGQAASTLYLSPAHRTDGGGPAATTMPEGARCRIDPTWDLNYLNPAVNRDFYALKIAKAIQRYGFFVTDITHFGCALAFRAPQSYYWAGAVKPYIPTTASWDSIMRAVPWHKLQVLAESVSPE